MKIRNFEKELTKFLLQECSKDCYDLLYIYWDLKLDFKLGCAAARAVSKQSKRS